MFLREVLVELGWCLKKETGGLRHVWKYGPGFEPLRLDPSDKGGVLLEFDQVAGGGGGAECSATNPVGLIGASGLMVSIALRALLGRWFHNQKKGERPLTLALPIPYFQLSLDDRAKQNRRTMLVDFILGDRVRQNGKSKWIRFIFGGRSKQNRESEFIGFILGDRVKHSRDPALTRIAWGDQFDEWGSRKFSAPSLMNDDDIRHTECESLSASSLMTASNGVES